MRWLLATWLAAFLIVQAAAAFAGVTVPERDGTTALTTPRSTTTDASRPSGGDREAVAACRLEASRQSQDGGGASLQGRNIPGCEQPRVTAAFRPPAPARRRCPLPRAADDPLLPST